MDGFAQGQRPRRGLARLNVAARTNRRHVPLQTTEFDLQVVTYVKRGNAIVQVLERRAGVLKRSAWRQDCLQLQRQLLLFFGFGRELLAGRGFLEPIDGIEGTRGRSGSAKQDAESGHSDHDPFAFHAGLSEGGPWVEFSRTRCALGIELPGVRYSPNRLL